MSVRSGTTKSRSEKPSGQHRGWLFAGAVSAALCGLFVWLLWRAAANDSLADISGLALLLATVVSAVAAGWMLAWGRWQGRHHTAVKATQTQSQSAQMALEAMHSLRVAFPLVLMAKDAKVEDSSAEIRHWLGYDENIGDFGFEELVHPKDWEKLQHATSNEDASAALQLRLRHKQGHWVWLAGVVSRHILSDQITQWLLVGRDVGGEKILEQTSAQTRRLESAGLLAAGLAHELNNMLTVIGGYADLLPDNLDKTPVTETVDEAARLIQKLVDFGRVKAESSERCEVFAALRDIRPTLEAMFGADVSIAYSLPEERGEGAWLPVSYPQLQRILFNLAENAKEAFTQKQANVAESRKEAGASPQKFVFSIKLELQQETVDPALVDLLQGDSPVSGAVRIVVEDNGCGMDEHDRQFAFDPFHTTKMHSAGGGLGLASVYGIVSSVGGSIKLRSQPMRGTLVDITLPQVEEIMIEADLVPAAPIEGLGHGSVLVVEDDQLIADLVARNLVGEGYNVTIKNDVASAWEQLGRQLPDLLVTDIMMPDGRGTELAERLRERKVQLPILFISGYPDQQVGEWKQAGGRVLFLAKPFRRKELLARVAELIGSRPNQHASNRLPVAESGESGVAKDDDSALQPV